MKTNIIQIQQTMTSLEIAELTVKQHKNIMQAIKNMETAWDKVNGLKFLLVEYRDKKAVREHVDPEDKGVNEMGTPSGLQ